MEEKNLMWEKKTIKDDTTGSLKNTYVCPSCHASVDKITNFCPHCGVELEQPEEFNSSPELTKLNSWKGFKIHTLESDTQNTKTEYSELEFLREFRNPKAPIILTALESFNPENRKMIFLRVKACPTCHREIHGVVSDGNGGIAKEYYCVHCGQAIKNDD